MVGYALAALLVFALVVVLTEAALRRIMGPGPLPAVNLVEVIVGVNLGLAKVLRREVSGAGAGLSTGPRRPVRLIRMLVAMSRDRARSRSLSSALQGG